MPETYEKQLQRKRRTPIAIKEVRSTPTKDTAISRCVCRICGEWITFTTNGNGGLLALNQETRRPHLHQQGC